MGVEYEEQQIAAAESCIFSGSELNLVSRALRRASKTEVYRRLKHLDPLPIKYRGAEGEADAARFPSSSEF